MKTFDTFKVKQYSHETEAWERLLYFYKQENAYLKIYLSEVVDTIIKKEWLRCAEYFQNKLIANDALFTTLLQEVHEQKVSFTLAKQKVLSEKLVLIERSFFELKKKFNSYLSAIDK